MGALVRMAAMAAGAAMLCGCSFQAALDKMVTPERQREIVDIGQRFCTDPVANTKFLHPDIASTAKDSVPLLPHECPGGKASWQLASYHYSWNVSNGLKERQEEAVVVGTGTGKWTTVSLRFYARNDTPYQIVSWNVLGSATKPEALVFVENYDVGIWRAGIGGLVLLLVAGGLIFWLVRRSRETAELGPAPPRKL